MSSRVFSFIIANQKSIQSWDPEGHIISVGLPAQCRVGTTEQGSLINFHKTTRFIRLTIIPYTIPAYIHLVRPEPEFQKFKSGELNAIHNFPKKN